MPRWPDDPSWLGQALPESTQPRAPAPAEPPRDASAPVVPVSVLGPYAVLGYLGRGGMGVVYRGRAPDGREVAIKILVSPDRDPQRLARFERERRLLRRFGEVDGFVPLLDAGDSVLGPYLVMPFVVGGTLRALLAGGPLAAQDAVQVVRAIATAVATAHARGVVHRDLKPENVLFTADRRPLVADLGLAKHFRPSTWTSSAQGPDTESRAFVGTAGYAAPEQMSDGRSVGPPADVFALGAMLYECLAGAPPFSASNVVELAHKIDRCDVPPLDEAVAPPALAAVVLRALARDPKARYADAGAFERALAGSVGARPRTSSHPGGSPGLRVAAVVTVGVFAALVGTLALVVSTSTGHVRLDGTSTSTSTGHVRLDEPNLTASTSTEQVRLDEPNLPASTSTSTSTSTSEDPRREAAALARTARDALLAGDLVSADDGATRALALDPDLGAAWATRATVRHARGDAVAARDFVDRAVALDPDDAIGLQLRALLSLEDRAWERAIADATHALERDARCATPWRVRAQASLGRGGSREAAAALADLERALALAPDDPDALRTRGSAQLLLGDAQAAEDDLTRALTLRSDDPVALVLRARARLRRDPRGALGDVERALALEPEDAHTADTVEVLVAALDGAGDRPRALEVVTQALTRWPDRPVLWLDRGVLRRRAGEWALAVADLERAATLAPGDALIQRLLGETRLDAGDEAGALTALERYLTLAKVDDPAVEKARATVKRLRGM